MMQKGLFDNSSPFVQLVMLAFVMMVCLLLSMLAGILFAPLLPGVSVSELLNAGSDGFTEGGLNLLRYMQVFHGIGLFIAPAFLAAWMFSRNPLQYLGFGFQVSGSRFQVSGFRFFATFLLMLAAMPCINLLVTLNEMITFPEILSGLEHRLKSFEETARRTVELFLKVDAIGGLFFNIFMIAVLPAIGEELIFRGVLQKILIRWTGSVHAGIVVSGLLFSMMHMQFYGFFPRWILGVMFGYLLVWSGTMWLPIFAHFVNNATIVFLYYLIHNGVISDRIEDFGAAGSELPATVLATAFCGWLLWIMYRNRILQHEFSEQQNETLA